MYSTFDPGGVCTVMMSSDRSDCGVKPKPPNVACSQTARKNDAVAMATIPMRWSSAQPMTRVYFSAIRSNQRLNRSSARAIGLRRSCDSVCGSGQ